jgi:hypothetical protein
MRVILERRQTLARATARNDADEIFDGRSGVKCLDLFVVDLPGKVLWRTGLLGERRDAGRIGSWEIARGRRSSRHLITSDSLRV